MKKKCFKCKQIKDLTQFYTHPKMKDGHLNKCILCAIKDSHKVRENRIEYYREYDRKRSMTEKGIKARKNYSETKEGKASIKKSHTKYRKENPLKYAATIKLNNALRDNKIIKPLFCSICGKKERLEGHHSNYNEPLNVIFICNRCHRIIHKCSVPILK